MLDTSVLIELEHRRIEGEEVAHLLPPDAAVAAISVAELWLGVHLGTSSRGRSERREFLEFVLKWCPVLPFGIAEAEAYAQLVAVLQANGRKMGDRDAQIAATAIAGGYEVSTYDVRDFFELPGLTLRPAPRE